MNKKQCREALDIYKRFLVRMDKVSEFLKVAEVSFERWRVKKSHFNLEKYHEVWKLGILTDEKKHHPTKK